MGLGQVLTSDFHYVPNTHRNFLKNEQRTDSHTAVSHQAFSHKAKSSIVPSKQNFTLRLLAISSQSLYTNFDTYCNVTNSS